MGKMFTAVAALQLIQAGKLALDAPISRYLPDYPNKEVAAVTIEQLLTHTGGTGNIFSPEYFDHRLETREHQDYIKLFGNRGVMFPPGSRWDYSNYGMILLGRIIEVVSGQSYYDYTRAHIFEPLGMTATGNEPEDSHVPKLVRRLHAHGAAARTAGTAAPQHRHLALPRNRRRRRLFHRRRSAQVHERAQLASLVRRGAHRDADEATSGHGPIGQRAGTGLWCPHLAGRRCERRSWRRRAGHERRADVLSERRAIWWSCSPTRIRRLPPNSRSSSFASCRTHTTAIYKSGVLAVRISALPIS